MTTAESASAASEPSANHGNVREYGGFADLLKPSSLWQFGGFPLPDGGFWQYREPNATVLVRNGRLQCSVHPLTRSHDRIQFLDNAKQMWFSKERFGVPERGAISFELSIAARGFGTAPGDLYDGFVSFNLLDFSSGWALDFFVSNDVIATVYGRLPFPGVSVPDTGPIRNFCLFKELAVPTRPGQRHDYRIVYDRAADTVEWFIDGELVNREEAVPDKIDGFTAALGLMTEKDLGPNGSTSLHGQGLSGEWSPLRITLREQPAD